jgi:penicillin-binding protein 2
MLAELYEAPEDQVDASAGPIDLNAAITEIRQAIVRDVEMRRRMVWYENFKSRQTKAIDEPGWEKWLAGDSTDGPDTTSMVPVAEETEPHVILRAIRPETITALCKALEHCPGLVLRPSTHRSYPLKEVACHVLGRLSRASASDNQLAKSLGWDLTRMYRANDLSGRAGIESLCEPLLRGSRGRIETRVGDDAVVGRMEFSPGADVQITIDAGLQAAVQEMLKHVRFKEFVLGSSKPIFVTPEPGLSMHAAAVVIDVKTGEVRAMASNPGFDVNELDERYAALVNDRLEDPLRNRATTDTFEPGSTVKPLIGLGAITQGVLGPEEGIECTGYLELPVFGPDGKPTGRKMRQRTGRCWVASEFEKELAEKHLLPIHHIIPQDHPHRGHDGYPDGWLSFSDALERSCNIFFETAADRLKQPGVTHWYDQFGFGRITGIGIAEAPGLIPRPSHSLAARMENCFSGIGQSRVLATPLQIANEAATIARNGIWMRPRLLTAATQEQLDAVRPRSSNTPPDRVDLHLDAIALEQARLGMYNVVNGGAGTGKVAQLDDIDIAGKTGTAQAAPIWIKQDGPNGTKIRQPLTPISDTVPQTHTPWYRASNGNQIIHGWFMGFAPAKDPQVAFCVLIEYSGEGGGPAACPVADDILEACAQQGYPQLRHEPK